MSGVPAPRALQQWGRVGLVLLAQLTGGQVGDGGGSTGQGRLWGGAELLHLAQASPRAGLKGGSSQSWPLLG